jgi:hypothetical protein
LVHLLEVFGFPARHAARQEILAPVARTAGSMMVSISVCMNAFGRITDQGWPLALRTCSISQCCRHA